MTRYGAGQQDAPRGLVGESEGRWPGRTKGKVVPSRRSRGESKPQRQLFATIFRQGAYQYTWLWYATRLLRDVPRLRSEWRIGGTNRPTGGQGQEPER
jgi:hypothetical protein